MCYILRPTVHSALHVKSSSAKGLQTATNISTNKLVPNENSAVRTQAAITCFKRRNDSYIEKQQKDENASYWLHVRS